MLDLLHLCYAVGREATVLDDDGLIMAVSVSVFFFSRIRVMI